jgi:hypothetical protein
MLFKRIKDWAVSITSFRTGDVIPVDGPKGTAKMGYSDLAKEVIKTTNISESIAPEFDPTKPDDEGGYAYYSGTPVMYDGSCYVFTSNKKSGAWDPSVVEKKPLSEAIQLEGIGEAVNEWLNEHPEATATVQDGSLTEEKFSDALKLQTIKDYVTPEMFGAAGDGATDDTVAFEQALASGKSILISPEKTYYIPSRIVVPSNSFIFGFKSSAPAYNDPNLKKGSIDLGNGGFFEFDNVSNIKWYNFKIFASKDNENSLLKILKLNYADFFDIFISCDRYTSSKFTGVNVDLSESGRSMSFVNFTNVIIRSSYNGLILTAETGEGWATTNVFNRLRVDRFDNEAVRINGNRITENIFSNLVIQDSYNGLQDHYGIVLNGGQLNIFDNITIWADAKGFTNNFYCISVPRITNYIYRNKINGGYAEGLIDNISNFRYVDFDFHWVEIDSPTYVTGINDDIKPHDSTPNYFDNNEFFYKTRYAPSLSDVSEISVVNNGNAGYWSFVNTNDSLKLYIPIVRIPVGGKLDFLLFSSSNVTTNATIDIRLADGTVIVTNTKELSTDVRSAEILGVENTTGSEQLLYLYVEMGQGVRFNFAYLSVKDSIKKYERRSLPLFATDQVRVLANSLRSNYRYYDITFSATANQDNAITAKGITPTYPSCIVSSSYTSVYNSNYHFSGNTLHFQTDVTQNYTMRFYY